jgi:hypothetical protein
MANKIAKNLNYYKPNYFAHPFLEENFFLIIFDRDRGLRPYKSSKKSWSLHKI